MPGQAAETVELLLGQLAPVPGDAATNVARIAAALASHPDADLAVFPELFVSGYEPKSALPWDDPAFDPIADAAAAAATTVIFGFTELCDDGSWANSAGVVTEDGRRSGTYRKTHLFGDFERHTFVAGDALRIFPTAAGRVGTLICFDIEFPEPARALARGAATLLVTCSANMEPHGPDHALAARARALDNRLPHVYVNRVGVERGLTFVGGSCVVNSGGDAIAALGSEEELRSVHLPESAPPDEDVDYLALLRPDLPVLDAAANIAQGGEA